MLFSSRSHRLSRLPSTPVPLLDAERLDCYKLALDFQLLSGSLARHASTTLRSQLERASVSIVLNIAEGAGRRSPQDKARFYSIARGSATECAAILDYFVSGAWPSRPPNGSPPDRSHRPDAEQAGGFYDRPRLTLPATNGRRAQRSAGNGTGSRGPA